MPALVGAGGTAADPAELDGLAAPGVRRRGSGDRRRALVPRPAGAARASAARAVRRQRPAPVLPWPARSDPDLREVMPEALRPFRGAGIVRPGWLRLNRSGRRRRGLPLPALSASSPWPRLVDPRHMVGPDYALPGRGSIRSAWFRSTPKRTIFHRWVFSSQARISRAKSLKSFGDFSRKSRTRSESISR